MSYKVKGSAGPFFQERRFVYDPEEGSYYEETTYAGSARAIEGQSGGLRAANRGHQSVVANDGTGQTFLRTPIPLKASEFDAAVRYEINTEFLEQDIFRHNTVSDQADTDDASLSTGDVTFRKFCERAVEEHDASVDETSVRGRVITHLRKGVTGFEREYIVLKRSRRMPWTGKLVPPTAAILEGRFIYTTEQLGVPASVAFSLPSLDALPASEWDDVQWGWRRRPSSVVFSGDFIEQTSEFVLAEWSLLLYEVASGSASW